MNALEALAGSVLIQRLGWTLWHSLWQVLAVAIGLALVLAAVRRRGARAAYAASCLALVLCLVLPAATFPLVSLPAPPPAPVALNVRSTALSAIDPETLPIGGVKSTPLAARRHRPLRIFTKRSSAAPDVERSPAAAIALADRGTGLAAEPPRPSFYERARASARKLQAQVTLWLPWSVVAWTAGVLAVSLWNLGAWFAVQRLKSRQTSAVSSAIQEAAAGLARRLGLTRTIRILQSALVDSPMVIGALKPVILLPASLISQLPSDQLESLLAHELAHVLRQDYLVNLLQSLIETLLFYHPAVWWISRQVRAERENCCDDLAVNVANNRDVYVRALAAVAGARTSAMVPAATGGILLPRLRRILGIVDRHGAQSSRWLTGAAILSLCAAVAVLSTIGSRSATAQTKTAQPAAAKEPVEKAQTSTKTAPSPAPIAKPRRTTNHPEFPTKGHMRIHVTDAAGQSLAGAGVLVSIWTTQANFKATRDYLCDSQGFVTVDLPKSLWILRLWGSKKGYCQELHNFETNASVHELAIPDEFAFHLIKGTTVSGTVKNEDGRPVQGANVDCTYISARAPEPDPTSTDAKGRYEFDGIRTGIQVRVSATHPDYLAQERHKPPRNQQKVTTQAPRTEVAPIVMQRGIRATVKVTDPAGKPVKGAVLIVGDDLYVPLTKEAFTNANGLCRLPARGAGLAQVTVVAKGWMPDTRKIAIGPKMGPIDIQLRPGKKLRIRIVDRSGAPVPKVYVTPIKWRGIQHLMTNPDSEVELEIPGRADKNGVYEWNWAPDDAVSYVFEGSDVARTERTIVADGLEHVETADHVLRISGSVRDAATGKSIDRFLLAPILYFWPDRPILDRGNAQWQTMGTFALQFDRRDTEHGIQIEAPGYKTFRTTQRYRVGEADPALDVRLQPGQRYVGKVLGPDGRPVKGARVSMASRLQQLDQGGLTNSDRDGNSNSHVDTNSAGAFEIPSQLDRYALVVVAPDGFAEVERQPNQIPGEIRLARWAKVTGRLVQSGKPMPNCEIFLTPIRDSGDDAPLNSSFLTATTAADGSFVFEHAPPVASRVNAWLHWGRPSPLTSSHSMPLRLAPGETADVLLGGNGIDVTGQLVAENQRPGFDYHFARNFLVARRPGIEPPAFLAGKGFDWQKGWSDSWLDPSEGHAYLNTLHHWFVKPEPDGRFRISGVEPGDYDFAVNLYGTVEGCLVHPIAQRVVHFSVKPGNSSLDLGKLSIPSLSLPKIGDTAGDFSFESLGGGKTSLAALRGNYVLIDFWATWCGSCVGKLDAVEHLREQFAGDKPLVVVGANLDADRQRAKDFLKSKPLPWQHALLGDWSSTDVPRRFAISGIPAYILIGPNGRILAHENSLEEIASKLKGQKQTEDPLLPKRS